MTMPQIITAFFESVLELEGMGTWCTDEGVQLICAVLY